jgi:quinolinate synthase
VVKKADLVGSTEFIIRTVSQAPSGSMWAVGTELNLVNRLKQEQSDKQIFFLSPMVCRCSTMFRIDAPHLCWTLENVANGTIVNHIQVPEDDKSFARLALDRMMALS